MNFETIRSLRGIAALLVIVFHFQEAWVLRTIGGEYWNNGVAGVDIFFVISGFVMVVSSQKLLDKRDGYLIFMKRRALRIVPLYWIFTVLKIVTVLLVASASLHTIISPKSVACSFFFLPFNHINEPILSVGWTLVHEMSFYALFSLALWTGLGLGRVVLPLLSIMVVIGVLRQPHFLEWPSVAAYCQPIIAEFGFGLIIGLAVVRGVSVNRYVALAILAISWVLLLTDRAGGDTYRSIRIGLPAAGIVLGFVLLEQYLTRPIPKLITLLGDASYSLYLTHTFVVPAVTIIALHFLGNNPTSEYTALLAGSVISLGVGVATYLYLENPLLRRLNSLFRRVDTRPPVKGGIA